MSEMHQLEQLAREFADAQTEFFSLGQKLQKQIDTSYYRHINGIREARQVLEDANAALRSAVEASPELFVKPKTRTLHGVKFGYKKQRGKVIVEDEAAVVKRIRNLLPEDQQELMIRITEAVHKPAVYDLTAKDLKRLGITLTDDEDIVEVKSMDSDIVKFLKTLISDIGKLDTEVA